MRTLAAPPLTPTVVALLHRLDTASVGDRVPTLLLTILVFLGLESFSPVTARP